MTGAICAFVSFVVSSLMLPYIIQLASKHGLFDSTGGRKIHSGKVPRLGGIGIALGWTAGLLATLLFRCLNPGAVSFGRFIDRHRSRLYFTVLFVEISYA